MIGIYEAALRVGDVRSYIALGVVPTAEALSTGDLHDVGHAYCSNGDCYAQGRCVFRSEGLFGQSRRNVHTFRVCLNLDANTVAFRKDGADIGAPQKIAAGDSYHFAFGTPWSGNAVTILGVRRRWK